MTTSLFLLKFSGIRTIYLDGSVGWALVSMGIRWSSIHWLTKRFDRVILKTITPDAG
jgi:hypothetical protein